MPKKCEQDNSWERQEGEGEKAYEAFLVYRDMGAKRNVRAVGQKLNKSLTQIGKWSSRWNWVERCRAWDNQLQKEAKKVAADELRKMYQRHIKIAMQLQNVAIMSLAETKPADIAPKDLVAFIKVATAIERESRIAELETARTEAAAHGAEEPATLADAINEAWRRRQEEHEPEP